MGGKVEPEKIVADSFKAQGFPPGTVIIVRVEGKEVKRIEVK